MPRLKLTIEYDGTAYAGWQRQPNQPTIQAAIEDAFKSIAQTEISVTGAGRTDAGVHALGQVASCHADKDLPPKHWTRALNAVLPKDICIVSTEVVPEAFHARYSAQSKIYEYRILNRRARSALARERAWHIRSPLDVPAMCNAASFLIGQHDFSSFQGHPTDTEDPCCNLMRLDITKTRHIVRITVHADRFLKQMIRAIVGTLVEVGQGRRSPESIKDMLDARDRRAAGYTAPAHGLYLVRVEY